MDAYLEWTNEQHHACVGILGGVCQRLAWVLADPSGATQGSDDRPAFTRKQSIMSCVCENNIKIWCYILETCRSA